MCARDKWLLSYAWHPKREKSAACWHAYNQNKQQRSTSTSETEPRQVRGGYTCCIPGCYNPTRRMTTSFPSRVASLSARDESPLHSSQRLSSTTSNSLGPQSFSGAKLVVSPQARWDHRWPVSLAITPQPHVVNTTFVSKFYALAYT